MSNKDHLNNDLAAIQKEIYDQCSLEITDFKTEQESKEYGACQFRLNGQQIICRSAKITPKKVGQFVTFWKRSNHGPIAPFHEADSFAFFVINVRNGNDFGQFVFPKDVLTQKGIVSTDKREGKRGFRVYPPWDVAVSKQAQQTQKWQTDYFVSGTGVIDFRVARELYGVG